MMTDAQVAQVCHEANTAYCWGIGDQSALHWDDAPDWQKLSAIAGVVALRANPFMQPEDMHVSWMVAKQADGWVYGPVKDAAAKTHPCLVPYVELPAQQRKKDRLFLHVARALIDWEETAMRHPEDVSGDPTDMGRAPAEVAP